MIALASAVSKAAVTVLTTAPSVIDGRAAARPLPSRGGLP